MGACNLYKDWTISSEASNRGTFNDQWVMSVTHVGLQAIGSSKRIDYYEKNISVFLFISFTMIEKEYIINNIKDICNFSATRIADG